MRIKTLLTLAIGGALAIPSFAATTTIDLGINGNAMIGLTTINFASNYPTSTTFATAPNYGNYQISQVQAGDLFANAGIAPGEFGQIQSLSMALEPVRPPQFTNPYTNTPFMTFSGAGSNLQLFLTAVLQGTLAPGSPYTLTPTPTGLVASISINGYVLNTTNNTTTNYTGTFSETFNGVTDAATLLSSLPLQTPFSATFTLVPAPAVPEPASLLLMGVGLLGASLIARRKIRS